MTKNVKILLPEILIHKFSILQKIVWRAPKNLSFGPKNYSYATEGGGFIRISMLSLDYTKAWSYLNVK